MKNKTKAIPFMNLLKEQSDPPEFKLEDTEEKEGEKENPKLIFPGACCVSDKSADNFKRHCPAMVLDPKGQEKYQQKS